MLARMSKFLALAVAGLALTADAAILYEEYPADAGTPCEPFSQSPLIAKPFKLMGNGRITSIEVELRGGSTTPLFAELRTDAAGSPGLVLATTPAVAVPSQGMAALTLTTPVSVLAAVDHWVVLRGAQGQACWATAGPPNEVAQASVNDGGTWSTLSNPAGLLSLRMRGTQNATVVLAAADQYSTSEDTPLSVGAGAGVLANDGPDAVGAEAQLFGPLLPGLTLSLNGAFAYTPAPEKSGMVFFDYRLKGAGNSGFSAPVRVGINVLAVDDPPTFTAGPNLTVPADAGPQTFSGWATFLDAGPGEYSAALGFVVLSNDHPDLFRAPPELNPAGTLTFAPNGLPGAAALSVVLRDGAAGTTGAESRPWEFTVTFTGAGGAGGAGSGGGRGGGEGGAGGGTVARAPVSYYGCTHVPGFAFLLPLLLLALRRRTR